MRQEIEHRGPGEAACPDASALAGKGQRPVIAQQRCSAVHVELSRVNVTEITGLTDGSEDAVLDESGKGSATGLHSQSRRVLISRERRTAG